jgi:hypothetical protein
MTTTPRDAIGAEEPSGDTHKPRKRDYTDKLEFLRASAKWAELHMKEWPWGGPKDEDDEYYFIVVDDVE